MSLETSHENYIKELIEEIEILDPVKSKYTIRLLGEELTRVQKKAEIRAQNQAQSKQEFVKLTRKIMVPIDKYPCYNFIGKLMGPKATNIKRIQQETGSSVLILGQGSTRDKEKELMLAESKDPKFAHFKEPLHISIHVKGYKDKAEERLAAAVAEIEKYMDPNNDPSMVPGKYNTVQGVKPIIRVGVPPPDAIVLPSKSTTTNGYKPRPEAYDAYAYDATFDGTYEGYPSTGPTQTKKESPPPPVKSDRKKSADPPPIPRNPLKRALTPSSTSESSDDDDRSPPPARHTHKKPAMTVSNMFRRAYDSEDDDDDDDDDD